MKINAFLIFLSLGLATSLGAAESKPKAQIERIILQRIDVEGTDEELVLKLSVFPPGAASPPHLHPVVGLNYIIEGNVESQYEGKPLEHYKAGDSYLDLANTKHLIFRNTSSTQPLKFVIAYKIKKGVEFKQDL